MGATLWTGGWLRNLGLLAGLLGGFAPQSAEPPKAPPTEYAVKAAFLLNFTKFIEWPAAAFEDPRSPFTICVLGQDPFGPALDQVMEGEEVNGRKVAVQRLQRPPRAKACQAVFISSSEKGVTDILRELGPGVLTVGDRQAFRREGGMINFVLEGRRVRFDINRSAAASAGLTISARLLSVARSTEVK